MANFKYKETDPKLWSGRIDSRDDSSTYRWHQVAQCIHLDKIDSSTEFAILGFGCDLGVAKNKGRIGAADGPDHFRSIVGNLSWKDKQHGFIDVGTISPKNDDLDKAQISLGHAVNTLLNNQKTPLIVGGGHETAFGHYLGISSYLQDQKPDSKLGIINIDAHFDLRSYDNGAHSGSPFLQALEDSKLKGIDLNYFVYGINVHNNTQSLFNTAKKWGVQYNTNQEIHQGNISATTRKLRQFIEDRSDIYLTICLDVFNESIAPGVSAPAWHGIQLQHALDVIKITKNSGKLLSTDICELNPKFDKDDRTAKLTGMLVAELFQSV